MNNLVLKYGIITPAYNEAPFIAKFMESVIAQTVRPEAVVIVDDESSDETARLACDIAVKHEWIRVVRRNSKSYHQIGAKVVETFLYGLDQVDITAWDIVVKLDADLVLPPDYFERVLDVYRCDPQTGICGGVCGIPRNDTVEVEKLSDRYHLRGAIKSYRMSCYNSIGGLVPALGWDTLDELLAEYHGWKTTVIPDLVVLHKRPTGSKTRSVHLHLMVGEMFYRLGYSPFASLISALKRYNIKPLLLSSLLSLAGYVKATLMRPPKLVNRAQQQFIRKLRFRRMLDKLTEWF